MNSVNCSMYQNNSRETLDWLDESAIYLKLRPFASAFKYRDYFREDLKF